VPKAILGLKCYVKLCKWLKMSQLDPRIQVYLFQVINDVFLMALCLKVLLVNLQNKIYYGPVQNHDIQTESAVQ
jgi:hypothetical protein